MSPLLRLIQYIEWEAYRSQNHKQTKSKNKPTKIQNTPKKPTTYTALMVDIILRKAPDKTENRIWQFIGQTAASTPVLKETIDGQLKSFRVY